MGSWYTAQQIDIPVAPEVAAAHTTGCVPMRVERCVVPP
jgi:hypothetical protein